MDNEKEELLCSVDQILQDATDQAADLGIIGELSALVEVHLLTLLKSRHAVVNDLSGHLCARHGFRRILQAALGAYESSPGHYVLTFGEFLTKQGFKGRQVLAKAKIKIQQAVKPMEELESVLDILEGRKSDLTWEEVESNVDTKTL